MTYAEHNRRRRLHICMKCGKKADPKCTRPQARLCPRCQEKLQPNFGFVTTDK